MPQLSYLFFTVICQKLWHTIWRHDLEYVALQHLLSRKSRFLGFVLRVIAIFRGMLSITAGGAVCRVLWNLCKQNHSLWWFLVCCQYFLRPSPGTTEHFRPLLHCLHSVWCSYGLWFGGGGGGDVEQEFKEALILPCRENIHSRS